MLAGRRQAQCMRIQKLCSLFMDINTRVVQVTGVYARQAIDFSMQCRHERREVEFYVLRAPAKTFRMFEHPTELAGIDHVLFRHTAANDACAAYTIFFCDRDFGTRHSCTARSANAARTGANHKQIIIIGHKSLLIFKFQDLRAFIVSENDGSGEIDEQSMFHHARNHRER